MFPQLRYLKSIIAYLARYSKIMELLNTWSPPQASRSPRGAGAFDAQVLIDGFPFDAVTSSADLPVALLLLSGMVETGVPYQWDNDRLSIYNFSDAVRVQKLF